MKKEKRAPLSDAECIERGRKLMQASFERALGHFAEGDTLEEFLDDEGGESSCMLVRDELREIGAFSLSVPEGSVVPRFYCLTQWVYRSRLDGDLFYVLSRETKAFLERYGSAPMGALAKETAP